MNREDFPMLNNNIIYFDNGATTFKPKCVIESITSYYENYSANAHRGDYDISLKVDDNYEGVRKKVKNFINATLSDEIIFTSGTTQSMNMIVNGFFKNVLNEGDEVIISKSEHASNILPWFNLMNEKGIKIKYAPLDSEKNLDIDGLEKIITPKTKVISLAHITNVVGDIRDISKISKLAHEHNCYMIVDAAQSIAHQKIDVQEMDVDFLAFSGHKMYGPTGIGVLYGKSALLEQMIPQNFGGGMNLSFTSDGKMNLKELPSKLEGGTPNIAGVIGLGSAIDYINNIGLDKISEYEENLKDYLLERLAEVPNVIVYNKHLHGHTVAFNIKDVFSQDTAIYLNKYHICVRAGNHCAKILQDEFGINNTCRISLSFYNTKEEIDLLINVLKNSGNIWKEIL